MAKFNLGGVAPRCPLCGEWMTKKFDSARRIFIFACDTDAIAIRVDDPFVGRWEQALENVGGKIECPNPACGGTAMRYFATSIGFMKAVCPKCKCSLANTEPDRDKTKPQLYTPDKPQAVQ